MRDTSNLPPDGASSCHHTDPNVLVREHLYLVQHVVNQVANRYPRHVERSDLWSAGAQGLVDASRRYDPATGVPFARYAAIRIRGAIIDSTRTRDLATRSLRRHQRLAETAAAEFEARHGRSPDTDELAAALDMTVEELRTRQRASVNASVLYLDLPVAGTDGESTTYAERLPETDATVLPQEALEHQELVGTVRTAVANLDAVHREVIERHFFGGELLRDIAESYGYTEARISQIRSEALNAMRAYFSTAYDGVQPVPENAPGLRRRAAYVASMASQSNWRTRLAAAIDPRPASFGLAAGA
jgi:RNA polymerase sigma factor FliA